MGESQSDRLDHFAVLIPRGELLSVALLMVIGVALIVLARLKQSLKRV